MIGLLPRVSEASVTVDGERIGQIGAGLLVLLCAERGDTRREADALLAKLLGRRAAAGAAVHAGRRHALGHTAIVYAGRAAAAGA